MSVSSFVVVGPGVFEHLFESSDVGNPGVPVLANTQYYVRVRPLIMGTGLPMDTGPFVVVYTRPIVPQNLLPFTSNHSVSLTWTGTNGVAMNNPLTNYGLKWEDPGGQVGSLGNENNTLSATATPLDRNTIYKLTVTARAIEGTAFDVFASTDKATLSDPTGKPSATSTPTSLLVNWDVGLNTDGTRYRVCLSTDTNFLDDGSFVVTESSKSFNLLDSNRIYHFQVKAINSENAETTPNSNFAYTYPVAPVFLPAVRSTSQLTFFWDPKTNIPQQLSRIG